MIVTERKTALLASRPQSGLLSGLLGRFGVVVPLSMQSARFSSQLIVVSWCPRHLDVFPTATPVVSIALIPSQPSVSCVLLSDDIELEYYRLQKIFSRAIDLADNDHYAEVKGPTDVGTGDPEEDEAPLSEIIERLNERFGTDFTESERLFLQQVQHDATSRDDIRCTAEANPFDKFSLSIRPQLQKLLIERMAGNDELVTRCLDDPDFREVVYTGLLESIFDTITA